MSIEVVTGRIVSWVTKKGRASFGLADVPGLDRAVRVSSGVVARRAALRRGDLVRLDLRRDGIGRPIAVAASLLHR